jgi:hypothetical protein
MPTKDEIIRELVRCLAKIPGCCGSTINEQELFRSSHPWPTDATPLTTIASQFSKGPHKDLDIDYNKVSGTVEASLMLLWYTQSPEKLAEGMEKMGALVQAYNQAFQHERIHPFSSDLIGVYNELQEIIKACSKTQIDPNIVFEHGKQAYAIMKQKAQLYTKEEWNAGPRYEGGDLRLFLKENLVPKKSGIRITEPTEERRLSWLERLRPRKRQAVVQESGGEGAGGLYK